jgi:hypothetical protein
MGHPRMVEGVRPYTIKSQVRGSHPSKTTKDGAPSVVADTKQKSKASQSLP